MVPAMLIFAIVSLIPKKGVALGICIGYSLLYALLAGSQLVYYKIFDANSGNVKGTEYSILAGDKVNIRDTVTKEMMGALIADDPSTTTVNESNYPTLTFKAYAIQLNEANGTAFEPADAWNLVKDAIPANP